MTSILFNCFSEYKDKILFDILIDFEIDNLKKMANGYKWIRIGPDGLISFTKHEISIQLT